MSTQAEHRIPSHIIKLMSKNSFGAAAKLRAGNTEYEYFRLATSKKQASAMSPACRSPPRSCWKTSCAAKTAKRVSAADIDYVARGVGGPKAKEISFMPARVLLQDFTGVPAVVDLAAMRDALAAMGADPGRANPLMPADLVIDHSVQVDAFGTNDAFCLNALLEFQRNRERYMLLRWGQTAFQNFRVVPPDTGIVHQVNLEYLASVVFRANGQAYPDSLVGTDSHTTMINGLGVLGWGVGGIEAEACMLGQPISMLLPPVVGFKLHGKLTEGCTATDLVLTITQMLRKKGVVGKFVEFYGAGLSALSLADRATVANMAPEYGATMGFFPVDDETLAYLRVTNRDAGSDRAGRSLHQGAGPLPHRPDARPALFRHSGTRSLDRRALHGRPQASAGSRRTSGRRQKFPRRISGRAEERHGRNRRPGRNHRRRRGRDRRHYQLHQYLQSVGDAGRRPASPRRPSSAASPSSRGSRPASRPAPKS